MTENQTMRAVKLVGPGRIEIQEVPIPRIGDDEILVKVAAAGLCHSDLHILHQDENWPFFGTTMGHETAGHVAEKGINVTNVEVGDPVLIGAVWSCGECRPCRLGRGNACAVSGSRTMFPATPGIAVDGGMAEYTKVDAKYAYSLAGIDPAAAAPLADAGTTPMRAVSDTIDLLEDGGTAVIIGVGGLGHIALQILRARTDAQLVAVDLDPEKLTLASESGADVVVQAGPDAAARLLELTDGYGIDVVYDFVGVQSTVELAAAIVAPEGAIRLVGLSDGALAVYASLEGERLPWGVSVRRPYGGTGTDQNDVLGLARNGSLSIHTVTYSLDDAQRAFDDLEAGRVRGRAVLVP